MPTPTALRGAALLGGALLVALAAASACQTYDFEPVAPLAIRQTQTSVDVEALANKPNFLLLVDKSGSMDQPVDPTNPACHVGGVNGPLCGDPQKENPCDAGVCPTRWSELSKALTGFVDTYPLIGRYGLSMFPEPKKSDGGVCTASECDLCDQTTHETAPLPTSATDDDATLQAAAGATRDALLQVGSCSTGSLPGPTCTGGGTPTAASLAFLTSVPALVTSSNREQIVILFTDGLPNCNPALGSLAGTAACQCTFGPNPDDCAQGLPPFDGAGCLDVDQAVKVIQTLGQKSVQTFVVGFGAELGTVSARDTLQRMAVAGATRHPQVCPGTPPSQPCDKVLPDGGVLANPCDLATGLCSRQYYVAQDASSLGQVLTEITKPVAGVCERFLTEVPDDPQLLSVLVNGTPYASGPDTWVYVSPSETTPVTHQNGPAVVFVDGKPLCDQLRASTAQAPVKVQIRILKIL